MSDKNGNMDNIAYKMQDPYKAHFKLGNVLSKILWELL